MNTYFLCWSEECLLWLYRSIILVPTNANLNSSKLRAPSCRADGGTDVHPLRPLWAQRIVRFLLRVESSDSLADAWFRGVLILVAENNIFNGQTIVWEFSQNSVISSGVGIPWDPLECIAGPAVHTPGDTIGRKASKRLSAVPSLSERSAGRQAPQYLALQQPKPYLDSYPSHYSLQEPVAIGFPLHWRVHLVHRSDYHRRMMSPRGARATAILAQSRLADSIWWQHRRFGIPVLAPGEHFGTFWNILEHLGTFHFALFCNIL